MAAVPPGALVVFALIAVALTLFVTEALPPDITAIGVLVSLAVLEPYTGVPATDAIAGFASTATVTIIAMYALSEGIQRTGVVERLGVYIGRATGGDETRLLAATLGTTGAAAGAINNTPVVAVFIPMVNGLAERAGISPSKLLLPLSYAAMLGGTLTLIGTSTNLLASDFAREIPGRGPIGMFEFTPLGVVVFLVGVAYLLTVGRRLTPERIKPATDLTEAFELENRLVRFEVGADSPLVGLEAETAREELAAGPPDAEDGTHVDLLLVERNGEAFRAQSSDRTIEPGDTLLARTTLQAANRLTEPFGLRHRSRADVSEAALEAGESELVGTVVSPDSEFVGRTVAESRLADQFDTSVLAVLRDGAVLDDAIPETTLAAGDTLLVHTTPEDLAYLREERGLVPMQLPEDSAATEPSAPLDPKTPVALAIMLGVIAAAALGVVPIVIAALGGVFAMVVTGCLTPADAYDAVSWNVVFLLAGVLPLGVALQRTGGAELIAGALAGVAVHVPDLGMLALCYLLTGTLAALITPVASVVLMSPIAIDTAQNIGSEPFSFLLAVAFAGSAAFATPIGYQTNLMVYGPGGYKFTDYVRVGAPLQVLLTAVVSVGIATLFGL